MNLKKHSWDEIRFNGVERCYRTKDDTLNKNGKYLCKENLKI